MSPERVFEIEILETTTASSTYHFTIPANTPVPESDDEWYDFIQEAPAAQRYAVSTGAYESEMEISEITEVTPRIAACESAE